MIRFFNFIKKNSAQLVGKGAGALASASLGFAASGFIIEFAKSLGFGESSPVWLQATLYGGTTLFGLNAAYRIWSVVKVGSPNGLKLIFGESINKENWIVLNRYSKLIKMVVVTFSVSAGATYGGLAYLGISHILEMKSLWEEFFFGITIIGSCSVASGSLFSYAWIQNINAGTLFTRYRRDEVSRYYAPLEIISSSFAVFGLGLAKVLGFFGLAQSLASLDSSTILVSSIAVIGFVGEVPFSIKQARLLVFKLSKFTEKSLTIDSSRALTDFNSRSREINLSTYAKTSSILIYMGQSFAGTYVNIGNFSIPLRATFSMGSAYISLVGSLEEETSSSNTAAEPLLNAHKPLLPDLDMEDMEPIGAALTYQGT